MVSQRIPEVILSSAKGLYKILYRALSESVEIPNDSIGFYRILKESTEFFTTLLYSIEFYEILYGLIDSERFRGIPQNSKGIFGIPKAS